MGQSHGMLPEMPVQGWILIALAAAAYTPALYVYRYLSDSPARHDVTAPPKDFSWRTPQHFYRNVLIVIGLVALSGFIFTSTAENFARSPSFFPLLIAAGGLWSLWTVYRGIVCGQIEPLVRGFSRIYERTEQPKRFWVSVAWNGFLGCLFLWLAFVTAGEAPDRAMRGKCSNYEDHFSPSEAVAACNQLLAGDARASDRSDFLLSRGNAHYELKHYRQAQRDYAESIRLDPESSAAWYNLGLVYGGLGQPNQALDAYTKAISSNDRNDEAYANRAALYLNRQEFDLAIKDFNRVVELKPDDPEALENRRLAYAWKKDQAKAWQELGAIAAVDEESTVLLHQKALLSLKVNDPRRAIEYLTQAIAGNGRDRWAITLRAEIHDRLGETEKGKADTERLLELNRLDAGHGRPH